MPPAFSNQQSLVFESHSREKPWRVGDEWIDLYALLGVAHDSHPREIDEAIVGRSAQCLQFAFARGAGSEYIALLERHLPEFRRVLLDESQRVRYDELLRRQRAGQSTISYVEFLASVPLNSGANGCLAALGWLILGAALFAHSLAA